MAGHAEEVKPIFERAIPNIPGKSLVALVLRSTVEFGGRSGGPSSENWRLSLAQTLSGSRRLLDKEYPRSEVASKHQQS
jgi:hypothetical protein